ncbi:putative phage abortive infection protein, partial [Belliella sp. DSM 111904]
FIGGITAPFLSLIAIVLLYITYRSQKEELFQSRQLLKKQTETLDKQQFETTFYNMLNLHNDIVNNIDLVITRKVELENKYNGSKKVKTQKKGRDCFTTFYKGLKRVYALNGVTNERSKMNSYFWKYYKRHQSDLGHYFRNLYHIYKLIHNSKVDNKKEYASLVRAQLSSHELLMLFYNGLSDQGAKFKKLIEEFQILKNMPLEDLISPQHEQLYSDLAYGLNNRFRLKDTMATKDELKNGFKDYLKKIDGVLVREVKTIEKQINTNIGVFELDKIEQKIIKELYFEGELHEIFSPKGIKVSGVIGLKATVREYNSKDEEFMTRNLKMQFNQEIIKFNFIKRDMELVTSGEISHTSFE